VTRSRASCAAAPFGFLRPGCPAGSTGAASGDASSSVILVSVILAILIQVPFQLKSAAYHLRSIRFRMITAVRFMIRRKPSKTMMAAEVLSANALSGLSAQR